MADVKLKPCPFCGDDEPLHVPGQNEDYCTECSASAVNGNWNKRPIEDTNAALHREAAVELKKTGVDRDGYQQSLGWYVDNLIKRLEEAGKE